MKQLRKGMTIVNKEYVPPSTQNRSPFKQITKPYSMYLLYVIILIISLLRLMPWNRLGLLTVSGNHFLTSDEVITWSQLTSLHPKRATFKQVKQIEQRLKEKSPLINSIQLVKTDWLHTQIQIEESMIVGKTTLDNKVYSLTQNGVFLEGELVENSPVLLFEIQDPRLEDFVNALGNIDPDLLSKMETIQLTPKDKKGSEIKIKCFNNDLITTSISKLSRKLPLYNEMKKEVQKQGVFHLDAGAYFTPTIYPEDQLDLYLE